MYFGEGNLRQVQKRITIQFLDTIREGKNPNIDFHQREGKTEEDAKDSPEK